MPQKLAFFFISQCFKVDLESKRTLDFQVYTH